MAVIIIRLSFAYNGSGSIKNLFSKITSNGSDFDPDSGHNMAVLLFNLYFVSFEHQ